MCKPGDGKLCGVQSQSVGGPGSLIMSTVRYEDSTVEQGAFHGTRQKNVQRSATPLSVASRTSKNVRTSDTHLVSLFRPRRSGQQ